MLEVQDLRIQTPRLELVPATAELIRMEISNPALLSQALDAQIINILHCETQPPHRADRVYWRSALINQYPMGVKIHFGYQEAS